MIIFLFNTFLDKESQNFLAPPKYFVFSPFNNSLGDRINYFKFGDITVPGPTVHGPPTIITIFGGMYDDYAIIIAVLSADPKAR